MSLTTAFRENIRVLKKQDPNLVTFIESEEVSSEEFCKTRNGEMNLKLHERGKVNYLHSNFNAEKEAEKWFKSLDIKDSKVLYVYGIGLGYYYRAAKSWLEESPQNYLIFIEDDMTILRRFLEMDLASEILKHPQVLIQGLIESAQEEADLSRLCWTFVTEPRVVSALQSYRQLKSERFIFIRSKLLIESVANDTIALEFNRFGKVFFKNFFPNVQALGDSYDGHSLFNKFHNKPAIICGAGPSLNKNIHLLKGLSEQALLFAGGSALNMLMRNEVTPHFGVGVDPHSLQTEIANKNGHLATPYFYTTRFNADALDTYSGAHLYLRSGGGYPIIQWMEKELGVAGEEMDSGYNVVHCCLEIARKMGCNPIVLVGMDLSFKEEHSTDIDAHLHLSSADAEESNLIIKKDMDGNEVKTHWKWIQEGSWIEAFSQEYPSIKLLNATEGGVGFRGITALTLEEAAAEHLKRKFPLREWVHQEIQQARFSSLLSVTPALEKLKKSLQTVLFILEDGENELAKAKKKCKQNRQVDVEKYEFTALCGRECKKEVAFKEILEPLSVAYHQQLIRRFHRLSLSRSSMSLREYALQVLAIYCDQITFFKEATLAILEELK